MAQRSTQPSKTTLQIPALRSVRWRICRPSRCAGKSWTHAPTCSDFGTVLYEMATGRQAFSGQSTALTYEAILHHAPISPIRINPEIPLKLEEIIEKTLEKDRELRYQSAGAPC